MVNVVTVALFSDLLVLLSTWVKGGVRGQTEDVIVVY